MDSVEETERSLHSPPKRRRSTFFVRRDSLEPQPVSQNDGDICKRNTNTEERHNDMSRYYEKLLQEKLQWKKEVNERRNKYHDLRLQYQMATKKSRLSYSALTNEDIEFLNAKINLTKLVDSAGKLHDTTKSCVAFVMKANELDDEMLTLTEKKVDKVVQHLIEQSFLET